MHDHVSRIYELLKELCKYSDGMSIDEDILKKRVLARGYSEEDLNDTVQNYLNLNLIMKEGRMITLIEG
jgi:hypothetical protein